jgi:response regulator RpfG family c-di-GMP phosphodiesterase
VETIRMLTALVASSNPKLGHYMKAVAQLALELATAAGLDEKQKNLVEMAGMVHDIGLLGMPDTLLEKDPKAMLSEESAAWRQHPTIAALSLSSVERLKDVAELVLAHQENWDGSGFPNRLQADQIPMGARILAVAADYRTVIDLWPENVQRLLATARRYMDADTFKSLDLEDDNLRAYVAEKIVIQGTGRRYDPSIVTLLLKLTAGQRPYDEVLRLPPQALRQGLILMQDLRLKDGRLLMTRGTVISAAVVQSLRNFGDRGSLDEAIEVAEPRAEPPKAAP